MANHALILLCDPTPGAIAECQEFAEILVWNRLVPHATAGVMVMPRQPHPTQGDPT